MRIEIDGCNKRFDGEHTPGIVEVLRELADHFQRHGVQLTQYPMEVHGYGDSPSALINIFMNLDESSEGNGEDSVGITSLDKAKKWDAMQKENKGHCMTPAGSIGRIQE